MSYTFGKYFHWYCNFNRFITLIAPVFNTVEIEICTILLLFLLLEYTQMLCCAEGIRAGLELYARLIVDLGENFTYPWWTAEQLKQFCTSWEKSLYDITASSFGAVESQKKFYFNKVIVVI